MKQRVFWVIAASLAVLVASGCAGRKSSSTDTDGDTGTATSAGTTTDTDAGESSAADTSTHADTSSPSEATTDPGTSSATQTEPGVTTTGDPDTLWAILRPDSYGDPWNGMLVVRNEEFGCADWDDSPTCDPDRVTFRILVRIEADQLVPGTYPLSNVIVSTFSVTGPNDDANDCWGGGGSFEEGSLVIHEIDDAAMSFRFEGTMSFDFDANDIDVVAERCP